MMIFQASALRCVAVVVALVLCSAANAAAPPGPDELTENSAAAWGADADGATAAVYDDAALVHAGSHSIRFETDGGFDTWLWNSAGRDADWDFTYVAALRFWVYAENPSPYDFQNNSPWIRLGTGPDTSEYWQYQAGYAVLNEAVGNWIEIVVPIAGDATWTRTQVGTPVITDIDYLEIHADTWDYGFTLWIDGLTLDAVPQNPTGLAAVAGDNSVAVSWDSYIPRPDFNHFAVYRAGSAFTSVAGMTPIGTVANESATTYVDETAVNGTTYYYAVTAIIDGVEDQTVQSVGPRVPTPRVDLTLTPFHSTVLVEWPAVSNPDLAGYEVYRSTTAGSYPADPVQRVLVRTQYNDYGLTPGQTYYYKVLAIDGAGLAIADFANEQSTTLDSDPAGYSLHKSMELLMVIYRGGYTTTQVNQMTEGLKKGLEFYWRTSSGRLHLDVTWMYLDGYPPGPDWGNSALQNDLRGRGVANDQYDLAYLAGQNLAGCYGGYIVFNSTCAALGTVCGVPYPGKDASVDYTIAWTFTHEIHHALEAMENITAGTPEVLFCHFPWAYPDPLGPTGWHMDWGAHYDGIAATNRDYGDDWMLYPVPYAAFIEFVDSDGDALPDDDARAWMDEVRFGSNPALVDSDGDGLDDLGEYSAYNFRGTGPNDADSDDDGRPDGADPQPLYAVDRYLPLLDPAPVVNGTIEATWPVLLNGYYFTQNSTDFTLITYAGYDATALYFAFESTRQLRFMISLDGSGEDGRFESPVRHTAGATDTYNLDNKGNHYGDSWADGSHLYTYYGASSVQVYGGATVSGSAVSSALAGGRYRTEVKIPRALPKGTAYTWYPPDAPVVDGLTLTSGQTIGLNVTFSNFSGSNGAEFSGTWTNLFETHALVDFTLQLRGDADRDGDFDLRDFAALQGCRSEPGVPAGAGCGILDFDGDGDVDLTDYGAFEPLLTGPQ